MNKEMGLIGLGVMGKSLALNLAERGFSLSLYNRHVPDKEVDIAINFVQDEELLKNCKGFDNISSFVADLELPRKIFLMVDAGMAVDRVINELLPYLNKGDVLIDGGNSHFRDTGRRSRELSEKGIEFIGTGVSGGEEGARKGPSIMPGGSTQAYKNISRFLEAIAAKDSRGGKCCAYIGPEGAGHYVKMVHNGIEYAEMQLIAEVYDLMHNAYGMNPDTIGELLSDWNKGEAASYLLGITADILQKKDRDSYWVDQILDRAGNKGTGSWTSINSCENGVPSTMITAALFARYQSSFWHERQRNSSQFGQPIKVLPKIGEDEILSAYQLSRIINHHQGFLLILQASKNYTWDIDFPELARIWTNGCIIRSALMEELISVLSSHEEVLASPQFQQFIHTNIGSLQKIACQAIEARIPVPCHSAALDHIYSMGRARGAAHIIQAQRDYFGAHRFQKLQDPSGASYHLDWQNI